MSEVAPDALTKTIPFVPPDRMLRPMNQMSTSQPFMCPALNAVFIPSADEDGELRVKLLDNLLPFLRFVHNPLRRETRVVCPTHTTKSLSLDLIPSPRSAFQIPILPIGLYFGFRFRLLATPVRADISREQVKQYSADL
jgi:hypothetical protein